MWRIADRTADPAKKPAVRAPPSAALFDPIKAGRHRGLPLIQNADKNVKGSIPPLVFIKQPLERVNVLWQTSVLDHAYFDPLGGTADGENLGCVVEIVEFINR